MGLYNTLSAACILPVTLLFLLPPTQTVLSLSFKRAHFEPGPILGPSWESVAQNFLNDSNIAGGTRPITAETTAGKTSSSIAPADIQKTSLPQPQIDANATLFPPNGINGISISNPMAFDPSSIAKSQSIRDDLLHSNRQIDTSNLHPKSNPGVYQGLGQGIYTDKQKGSYDTPQHTKAAVQSNFDDIFGKGEMTVIAAQHMVDDQKIRRWKGGYNCAVVRIEKTGEHVPVIEGTTWDAEGAGLKGYGNFLEYASSRIIFTEKKNLSSTPLIKQMETFFTNILANENASRLANGFTDPLTFDAAVAHSQGCRFLAAIFPDMQDMWRIMNNGPNATGVEHDHINLRNENDPISSDFHLLAPKDRYITYNGKLDLSGERNPITKGMKAHSSANWDPKLLQMQWGDIDPVRFGDSSSAKTGAFSYRDLLDCNPDSFVFGQGQQIKDLETLAKKSAIIGVAPRLILTALDGTKFHMEVYDPITNQKY